MAQGLRKTLPQRLRAAGIHLGLSALIFLAALYLILVQWYPGFHFTVDGGWQGVRIMAAVDLVLGPMLTLIIFNPFKARKLIVFDLSCIGLTQLGALIWGFYAIHSQHPVSINFSDGTFYSITAEPIKIEKYPLSMLAELSDRKPALIYVAPPANEEELTRAGMNELMGGIADYEDPLRFKAFAPNWETVKASAVDPAKQAQTDSEFVQGLERFLSRQGGSASDYLFFPYTGRYGSCTVAFSKAGELLDAIGCQAF